MSEYRQIWERVGAFQGFVGLSPDYTDETFPDFPALVGAVLLSGFDVFYLKCAPTGSAPSGTSSNRGKPAHSRFCPNRREQNELLARATNSGNHVNTGWGISPSFLKLPRLALPAVLYWTTFHRLSRGGAWMARQFITSAVPSILYRLRAKNRAGRKSPDRAGQFILRHRTAPTAGPKLGRLQIDRGPTLRRSSCRFRLACWSWKNDYVGKYSFQLSVPL